MTRLLPAALLSVLLAVPALAGGIVIDLPNLTFPAPEPTISTQGCQTDAKAEVCVLRP